MIENLNHISFIYPCRPDCYVLFVCFMVTSWYTVWLYKLLPKTKSIFKTLFYLKTLYLGTTIQETLQNFSAILIQ